MARHRRGPAPRRSGRRLVLVVLAPLLVLVPMSAWAGSTTSPGAKKPTGFAAAATAWSKSWSPPLALLVAGNTARYRSLPLSMATRGSQTATARATFRTNWVDVRALRDGPNIAQQGLSIHPPQFKLQIAHGPRPSDHRGNCHIEGATGHVLALGPRIDVADGRWHTITCIKYPDTASGTKVVVIVDGIAGKPKWSHTPIGRINPIGPVRLGGRSTLASTDSLDGWISKVAFTLA